MYIKTMSNKERFRIYIAAYLILKKDGKILLSKRRNTHYQDGNYILPAGHLEGKETAKQCIIREAKEEAGITLNQNNIHVIHVTHRLAPDREYIDIYLTANTWEGEVINTEPEKCEELKWFPLDHLPNNILPDVKFALANINKGIHYGEFGWK